MDFEETLAYMSTSDLKKHKLHAEEATKEANRIKKMMGKANLAAHAAAAEYLQSKREGVTTTLEGVATRYDTTVSMVRTAIKHQQEPFQVKKPGPRSLLSEQDMQDIGHYCIDRALNDAALLKDELRALMLKLVNQGRRFRGEEAQKQIGDSAYNRMRKALTQYWERLGTPLVMRKKTESVESCRRKAEKIAVPAFMNAMEQLRERFPVAFDTPANWMNLDEQALSEKGSKGKKVTTVQAPSVTDGLRGAQAGEKAAPPCTFVSTTFADGGKGPAMIFRKGKTPMIMSWFTFLPPGLTTEDIDNTYFGYGDSDRMTTTKFLDVLENVVYPLHAERASGELFWVFDAPTYGLVLYPRLPDFHGASRKKRNIPPHTSHLVLRRKRTADATVSQQTLFSARS